MYKRAHVYAATWLLLRSRTPAALVAFQDGQRVLDAVVYDVLDLQLVFVVAVVVGQFAKLAHQAQTLGHAFRRHEVSGHFDAVVQIAHLRTGTQNGRARYDYATTTTTIRARAKKLSTFFFYRPDKANGKSCVLRLCIKWFYLFF